MNEPSIVWVKMYMSGKYVHGLAIMIDNDVIQTKYITSTYIAFSSTSIGNFVHIVIENVTKNMEISSYIDTLESTTIHINDPSVSEAKGTWTSTIVPENVTVELDCEVVDNSTSVIVAKCDSESTWPESVFNMLPIHVPGINGAYFGSSDVTNMVMFGKRYFQTSGSIPSSWNESIQYNVTGKGSSLTIGGQFTIESLPELFVSHWVNMGAKAYMGDDVAIFVPPDS